MGSAVTVTVSDATAPGPRRGPFARWPRSMDAILGVLVIVGTLSILVTAEPEQGVSIDPVADVPWFGYLLVVTAAGSMLARRRWPLYVTGLNLVVTVAWELLEYEGDPSLGLLIAVYSVGRYVSNVRQTYGVAAATVLLFVLGAALDGMPIAEVGLAGATAWVPWYIGRRVLARRAHLEMLEERAAHLERERLAEAERAVAEERAAIARELHDVVAHRVSMMTVQAGAAKTIGADSPDQALRAVAAIEEEGRLALTELRHLLGILRPDANDRGGLGPQGALAQIPDLVTRLCDAGYKVTLEFDDDVATIPSRVSLAVYRVVQESLTNVVKHAGDGADVDVVVARDGQEIRVEIGDNGAALNSPEPGGYGIAGMQERVSILGGTLTAGPRRGGGWLVRAQIPLEGAKP